MKLRFLKVAGVAILLVLSTTCVYAEEVQQSQDYKLLPRFQGFSVLDYDVKDLDQYTLPTGCLIKDEVGDTLNLEGKITKIVYKAPVRKSTLEIFRYYEALLKKQGFETIFSGKGEALGDRFWSFFYKNSSLCGNAETQKFICAKLTNNSGDIYASVYTTLTGACAYTEVDVMEILKEKPETTKSDQAIPASPAQVIEQKPVAQGTGLEATLKRKGRVVVKGVDFAEGSDEIKSSSDKTIEEMAGIITNNPDMLFEIRYYTDSNGEAQYLLNLSKTRAESVLNALLATYNVDGTRVPARGMGPVTTQGDEYANRIELSIKR